ncbi:MAG: hypothetical protein AAF629_06795 [Chloroflexota bacterium]
MAKRKSGPNGVANALCETKDGVKVFINFSYQTHINDRVWSRPFAAPKRIDDKSYGQLIAAARYVARYYTSNRLTPYQAHIERQIKNCLNENYQNEADALAKSGLEIDTIKITSFKQTQY